MKQPKLVIASVLKPVNETRMYEKFALSIGQTKQYEINIIGFYAKKLKPEANIRFYPLFRFGRRSIRRVVAPRTFFSILWKIRPKVMIVSTHELLWPALIYKALSPCKIIYDVRENYYLNIRHTHAFPPFLRRLVAGYVRGKERLCARFIDHFILAESCYLRQIGFVQRRNTVIENKAVARPYATTPRSGGGLRLLFTGTLAPTTGVFEAIDLAKKLHAADSTVELDIVGGCHQRKIAQKIRRATEGHPYIRLTGGDRPVAHRAIEKAIGRADFGIIYYPANEATKGKVPTKLYEYLAARLPVITDSSEPVKTLSGRYGAAIHTNFRQPDIKMLLSSMKAFTGYKNLPGDEVLWKSEVPRLMRVVDL